MSSTENLPSFSPAHKVDSVVAPASHGDLPLVIQKPRVLIVDDEASVRSSCVMALRSDGWEAVGEESSLRALERLAAEYYNVLVLDYAMPELDGLAFVAALDPLARPPILLASAHADGAVAFSALRLGIWDFVAKPLVPDELRRRVRQLHVRAQATDVSGAWMQRALYHCTRCAWAEALVEIKSCPEVERAEPANLVMGLIYQIAGDDTAAASAFKRARWWPEWNRQGAEMWVELARRLN